MNKQDIAKKFPDKVDKWKRKSTKAKREADRDARIAKWEGKAK